MCVSIKSTIIAICLLATLVGAVAGIKCFNGDGDTFGNSGFSEKECPLANTCTKVDCGGSLDGKSEKFCQKTDAINCIPAGCTDEKGFEVIAKSCSFCKSDLCNSAFHHPTAFSLVIAIGALLAIVGHFLL